MTRKASSGGKNGEIQSYVKGQSLMDFGSDGNCSVVDVSNGRTFSIGLCDITIGEVS